MANEKAELPNSPLRPDALRAIRCIVDNNRFRTGSEFNKFCTSFIFGTDLVGQTPMENAPLSNRQRAILLKINTFLSILTFKHFFLLMTLCMSLSYLTNIQACLCHQLHKSKMHIPLASATAIRGLSHEVSRSPEPDANLGTLSAGLPMRSCFLITSHHKHQI